jgi:hypothetical protein
LPCAFKEKIKLFSSHKKKFPPYKTTKLC